MSNTNDNTPADSVSDANVAPANLNAGTDSAPVQDVASANLNAGTDSAPVQDVAPATPDYKKWYTPAPMPLTAEQGTPVQPGQIFASGSDNRDQDPPTNGESYNMNEPFSIPTDVDADGNPVPVTAKTRKLPPAPAAVIRRGAKPPTPWCNRALTTSISPTGTSRCPTLTTTKSSATTASKP